ncbi:DUF3223 domain-containing protein [Streptomyces sp. NPDC090088]|uniref:DUF3223 domain-containing protein n=1 Tax=Streptomyces sp. NPDC090088 TaxID=3365944 RepID=UPI003807C412
MPEFRIGTRRYPTKQAAGDAVRAVLYGCKVGSTVDRLEDRLLLLDLLDLHPEAAEKAGPGVEKFVIAPPLRGSYPGFAVVCTDGTSIGFSYLACLKPPTYRQQVSSAMRAEVEEDVNAFFASRVAASALVSDESGAELDFGDVHVSYFRGPSFAEIAVGFAASAGGWDTIGLASSTDQGLSTFTDRDLAEQWRSHHAEHAVLGLLSSQENLRRPRR